MHDDRGLYGKKSEIRLEGMAMMNLLGIQLKHFFGRILISCFALVFILLTGQTLMSQKDIVDIWILQGIFPIFVLFTLLYIIVVILSADLKLISVLTAIYLGTLNLIPHLKYFFIYGYFDPLPHYGFVQDLIAQGHVPTVGSYAASYGSTPGSQLCISELSIVAGFSPIVAMKAFLAVSPFMIPLVIYLALQRLDVPNTLSKMILIVTTITTPTLYRFVGTIGVYPLYVFFSYVLLLVAFRRMASRQGFVIASLLGVGVIISHDVTAFFVIIFLISVALFCSLKRSTKSPTLSSRRLLLFFASFIVMALMHLTLVSSGNFSYILQLVKDSFESIFGSRLPGAVQYYGGFYSLTLMQQAQVFVVRLGRDAASAFLVIVAPLALIRLKLADRLKTFYYVLIVLSVVCFVAFVLPFFVRSYIINRGLIYLSAFAPFLAGITLYWVFYSKHFRLRKVLLTITVLSLVSVSVIQLYPCQPLVPKISTDYGSFYVMDLRAVTTAYDRSMIRFIGEYDSQSPLAADPIISSQILALTDPAFQELLTSEDPTSENHTKAQLILVSLDENTHILVSGANAIEYAQRVHNITETHSVIYANSKSYVLLDLKGP
jgi:hypothetical protein